MSVKKKYLTRSKTFGYSIWNTDKKPFYADYGEVGIFINANYPYSQHEEYYVGEDFVEILFGSPNFIGYGECVEITLDIKGQ